MDSIEKNYEVISIQVNTVDSGGQDASKLSNEYFISLVGRNYVAQNVNGS